jgi:hypothetical protein
MGVCRGALVVGVLPALLFAQQRIQSLGGLALHFSQVGQSEILVFFDHAMDQNAWHF